VGVCLHAFLTSALDRGEWSASSTVALPRGKEPQVPPMDRRLGGPQSQSGRGDEAKKFYPLLGKYCIDIIWYDSSILLRHPNLIRKQIRIKSLSAHLKSKLYKKYSSHRFGIKICFLFQIASYYRV
jgi:hypothetical protein